MAYSFLTEELLTTGREHEEIIFLNPHPQQKIIKLPELSVEDQDGKQYIQFATANGIHL